VQGVPSDEDPEIRQFFSGTGDSGRLRHLHETGEELKKAGGNIKEDFSKAGPVIKEDFKKVGPAMKEGFCELGHDIKNAAGEAKESLKRTFN
jgi:hypothetical protein